MSQNQQNSENQLVISALGEDRPGIIHQLSQAILDSGGNIGESRMTLLGGEFAILMLVSAPWNAIAKLEAMLPGLEQKLGLTISSKRTNEQIRAEALQPYHVEVVAVDSLGIVSRLSQFFASRDLNIQEMSTSRYMAAHTGTPMFTMDIIITIPANTSLSSLREQFFVFCDELNIDAIIEPIKG